MDKEKKKATINVENEDDKCFQYSVTVALNYDKVRKKASKSK